MNFGERKNEYFTLSEVNDNKNFILVGEEDE